MMHNKYHPNHKNRTKTKQTPNKSQNKRQMNKFQLQKDYDWAVLTYMNKIIILSLFFKSIKEILEVLSPAKLIYSQLNNSFRAKI